MQKGNNRHAKLNLQELKESLFSTKSPFHAKPDRSPPLILRDLRTSWLPTRATYEIYFAKNPAMQRLKSDYGVRTWMGKPSQIPIMGELYVAVIEQKNH